MQARAADNEEIGEKNGGVDSLSASARVFSAACSGKSTSATHHRPESKHDLLRRVLLREIPGDVILVQPAARVHSRNTQYLSLARRACDHVSFQVVNACLGLRLVRDGLRVVNNHRRNQRRYFNLLDGTGTGFLQNGYGRGGRYTHRSES